MSWIVYSDGPNITEGEGKYFIPEGESVSLICGYNLKSNPKASITWTDPRGNPVTINDAYSQDDGPEVVQLNITSVKKSDNGTWRCSMEVLSSRTYDCIDRKFLDNGQEEQELPKSSIQTMSQISTNYVIMDVLCKCHVNYRLAILVAIFFVLDGPDIEKQGPKEQPSHLNKSTNITCAYGLDSNPLATITWTDPKGNPVTNSSRYTLNNGPDEIKLNIVGTEESDNGTWTCTIQVEYGGKVIGKKEFTIYHTVVSESTLAKRDWCIIIIVTIVLGGTILIFFFRRAPSEMNKPGKPRVLRIFQDSIELTWTPPKHNGSKITSYTVLYHSEFDPTDQWNRQDVSNTRVRIEGLLANTRYKFKVCAECKGAMGSESEITELVTITEPNIIDKPITTYTPINASDPVMTETSASNVSDRVTTETCTESSMQNQKSLAESLREHSQRIYSGTLHPDIYNPVSKRLEGDVTKCIIADPNKSVDEFKTTINERILMLVGATGAGKSTLINGIVNYIMGVNWDDDFRFKVITDEGGNSQAHSQTTKITTYSFHGSHCPYTLTVIDTPGFGDTRGIENDKAIVEQVKTLFSVGGSNSVDQIHGVGFVVQASSARLTPTQKYIFDSVLSVFGRDIVSNIYLLITFADGQEPPVLSAIKEANISYQRDFQFNNSALFADHIASTFNKMFWDLGRKNFELFFTEFEKAEARSLQLTRENLNERQQLEAVVEGLKMQIRVGLTKIDALRQEQRILRKREAEILQNEHFTYELTITKQRQVKLSKDVSVTNCLQCNFTCHYPCPIPKDDEKYQCKTMDGGGPDSAHCTVCPGNCHWSQHVNAPYRFELYYEVETHTSDDLKKNLSEAIEGKNQIEAMIANIEKELDMLQEAIVGKVREVKRSLERLQEIALKPNPLSEIEYIDLLIKAEKSEKSLGFTERIEAFEIIKDIVKQHSVVPGRQKTDNIWWRNVMTRKR